MATSDASEPGFASPAVPSSAPNAIGTAAVGWRSAGLRPRIASAAAITLAVAHVALVMHGAARHSAVVDEVVYAPAGYARLVAGGPDLNPEHPPAMKLLLGMSWLGTSLPVEATPGWREADEFGFGYRLLYADPAQAPILLARARLAVALLSGATALVLFAFTASVAGVGAALLAMVLFCFDPLVVAHAGVATLDLGCAAATFASVAAFATGVRRRRLVVVGASGVLLGIALGTKATALVALPAFAAVALAQGRGLGQALRLLALALGVAAAALSIVCLPEGPAAWLHALALQYEHLARHPAFAFGRYSDEGWWWYYPAVWAVKTPLPILAASAVGVAILIRRARRAPEVLAAILTVPAAVFAASIASGVCIGVRQLLPAVPFLAMAGGIALAEACRLRWGRVAATVIVAWVVAGTLAVHPGELAYANELAGGPSSAHLILADSNVDWGQDLPALAERLRTVRVRRLWLDYFGTAMPYAHGLAHYRLIGAGAAGLEHRTDGLDADGRELLAVSSTLLLDVYGDPNHGAHAWLRGRAPFDFAGQSIAVFDITGDADAHRALGATAEAVGDEASAAEAYARALEIAPSDGAAAAGLTRTVAALRASGWPVTLPDRR